MAVITVGKGKEFSTISAAVNASQDGDTVAVDAGTYNNDYVTVNHKITIEGVGGTANLVSSGDIPNGKAIMITNTDVTLENLSFSGAQDSSANGAGIRYQGGNMTIADCNFHDNENGILAAPSSGSINITKSSFVHNGINDTGYTHNFYADEVHSVTITNSFFSGVDAGHEIKSRADNTTIQNNVIYDGPNATANADIDLPQGGNAVITGNIIEKGPNSHNNAMVYFGEQGPNYSSSSLKIDHNQIVSDHTNTVLLVNDDSAVTASITNNQLYNVPTLHQGPATVSGNTVLTTEPTINTAPPWNGIGGTTTTSPAPSTTPTTTSTPTTTAPAPSTSSTTTGHTLTVGNGKEYSTIAAAVNASQDGDTIAVDAGTYSNDYVTVNHKITIEGVGGVANLVSSGDIPNGKAIMITNTDVTLEHLSFSGAQDSSANGAGIRYQGGNMDIVDCSFHDNEDGILAAPSSGSININNSSFVHNGINDTGYTHNFYADEVHSVTITNSFFSGVDAGHEIKSRADNTTIQNNVIYDGPNATANADIDLPQGGNAVITGNIIEKGANSHNNAMVYFGEQGPNYSSSSLQIDHNQIVSDHANTVLLVNDDSAVTASITNNQLYNVPTINQGPATASGNTVLTTEPAINTNPPWNGIGGTSTTTAPTAMTAPAPSTAPTTTSPAPATTSSAPSTTSTSTSTSTTPTTTTVPTTTDTSHTTTTQGHFDLSGLSSLFDLINYNLYHH